MWCVVFRIYYCHGVTLIQCHPVVTVTFKSAYHMNIFAARQKILRFIVSFIVMVAYDGSYRSPANNSQHRWSQLAMVCWQEIFMMAERCWTLFCCHTTEHYFWWHQCCGHVLVTICVTNPVPGLFMTLLRCPRSQVPGRSDPVSHGKCPAEIRRWSTMSQREMRDVRKWEDRRLYFL